MANPKPPKRSTVQFALCKLPWWQTLNPAQQGTLLCELHALGFSADENRERNELIARASADNYLAIGANEMAFACGVVHGFVVGARRAAHTFTY